MEMNDEPSFRTRFELCLDVKLNYLRDYGENLPDDYEYTSTLLQPVFDKMLSPYLEVEFGENHLDHPHLYINATAASRQVRIRMRRGPCNECECTYNFLVPILGTLQRHA
jgi:hypothetical protein